MTAKTLEDDMTQNHAALDAMVKGDSTGYVALLSGRDDVSWGNPFGPFARGRKSVEVTLAGAAAHGPYGPGHDGWRHDVPRDDGWLFGNDAFDECGIVRSVNTVMGDFLADAEARLERVSLDDISRQAQPNPLHPQHGSYHHG